MSAVLPASASSAKGPARLRYLFPGWFAIVMGLGGLALAWFRAVPLMGDGALAATLALGAIAAVVFVLLALAAGWRAWAHADAWREDLRHPVRHTFVATLPISAILLSTVAVALGQRGAGVDALWWLGSVAQLGVTAWVVSRWWRGGGASAGSQPAAAAGAKPLPGLQWAGVTPALFIPIVGNVLVPLAGVPLGHEAWAAAQFGVGLLFWPVVMTLIVVRLALQGSWPERLLPAAFVFIAPPAVVGLSSLQFGAPRLVGFALWGMAIFSLVWCGALVRPLAALPFGLPHWAMSFPLAALAALTLRLAEGNGAMTVLALALLALATLVVAGLALATVRGLVNGTLLVPEPVAAIQPAAAPAGLT